MERVFQAKSCSRKTEDVVRLMPGVLCNLDIFRIRSIGSDELHTTDPNQPSCVVARLLAALNMGNDGIGNVRFP
jgi:hypothetical protein